MNKETLHKFALNQLHNNSEIEEVINWIEASDENREEFETLKNLWAISGFANCDSYVDRKKEKAVKRLRQRVIPMFVLKYAAVFALAFLVGALSFYYLGNSGAVEVSQNEISVPKGNRTLVALPDGSEVWLTNGSKLIYPENFDADTRNVELQGEAFFKITHKEDQTFVVKLGDHQVKVLGTEFSVLSYPEDNTIQVDLITGKVQMDVRSHDNKNQYKSIILEPSHSLVFDKTSGILSKSKISDSFFKYWKDGVYEFEDELFVNLAKKVDRIFGVEIIFEDEEIKNRTFTGTINIDDNIYTMMEVFKHASGKPFEFRIERNKIYIKTLKKEMPM